MRKVTLNGKEFRMPELGFKEVLELEDYGVSLLEADKKPMNLAIGLIALAVGDWDTAVKEVEEHLSSGGSLEDVMQAVSDAIKESSFFQQMGKKVKAGEAKTAQ